jgi:hypothetical protein
MDPWGVTVAPRLFGGLLEVGFYETSIATSSLEVGFYETSLATSSLQVGFYETSIATSSLEVGFYETSHPPRGHPPRPGSS